MSELVEFRQLEKWLSYFQLNNFEVGDGEEV
jgi:hypothetical protein